MAQSLDASIARGQELVRFPEQLLEMAFSDTSLRRQLKPHHVGLLLPLCSHIELQEAVESHGTKILFETRSTVVATELSKRFHRSVCVDIYWIASSHQDAPTLELFRVADGLTAENIQSTMDDIFHIAYLPREMLDVNTWQERMASLGFAYVGGGVNHNGIPKDGAVTVLYFVNESSDRTIPRIELVLPGIHALCSIPLDRASASVPTAKSNE